MDDDLKRQLRNLADEASPRPSSEDVVVKRAKTKRRLAGGFAGLMLVALIGGLAGATTLLGDRGFKPAPGPEETAGCVSAGYDLAVFVPEEDFHDKMVEIEEHLRQHDAVARFEFVSAADAMQKYLRENPDQAGPAPTQARRSQYRVTVEAGVDPHRLSRELAALGDGASVPAVDCPPREPQVKFARYFFEVAEGRSSARGTLEVNWEVRTMCLDVDVSADIVASHLIDQHPELPKSAPSEGPDSIVALTFFEPGDRSGSFPSEPICLRDQEHEVLRQVIEDHERFAVDFHRGPDDEPGLVAELISQEQADACSGGPTITVVGGPAEPGDRVAFTGECWPDGPERRELRMFLTASLGTDGRPIPKEDFAKGEVVGCDLVARADNKVTVSHGRLHGWFVVPHEGNCTPKTAFGVPLLGGTYEVAVGCPACTRTTVRVVTRRTPIAETELETEFEFEPYPGSRWYGPDGNEVPRNSNIINAITGPEHCDWQSAVMMHVGWPLGQDAADVSESRQYLRDPEGVFQKDMLMTSFDAHVDLPPRAKYTGYRTDFMQLWLDDEHDTAAYLVFADHVERWPRSEEVIACA